MSRDKLKSKCARSWRLTVHGNITWLEPLWHIWVTNLEVCSTHNHSGDDHVVRDGDCLGLSGGPRREVVELWRVFQ
jgi:hypothetical protein